MKLKRCGLVLTGAIALMLSLNVNVMTPNFAVKAENTQIETRTTPCVNHRWEYVEKHIANIVYYNYECSLCYGMKYTPWLKK